MSDLKDEADEPAYEQLGDAGNPFTNTDFTDTKDADPNPDAVGQSLDVESEDEVDRAERHD